MRFVISKKRQQKAISSALFNARMEGFEVHPSTVEEGKGILTGRVSADELVRQYKAKYLKK